MSCICGQWAGGVPASGPMSRNGKGRSLLSMHERSDSCQENHAEKVVVPQSYPELDPVCPVCCTALSRLKGREDDAVTLGPTLLLAPPRPSVPAGLVFLPPRQEFLSPRQELLSQPLRRRSIDGPPTIESICYALDSKKSERAKDLWLELYAAGGHSPAHVGERVRLENGMSEWAFAEVSRLALEKLKQREDWREKREEEREERREAREEASAAKQDKILHAVVVGNAAAETERGVQATREEAAETERALQARREEAAAAARKEDAAERARQETERVAAAAHRKTVVKQIHEYNKATRACESERQGLEADKAHARAKHRIELKKQMDGIKDALDTHDVDGSGRDAQQQEEQLRALQQQLRELGQQQVAARNEATAAATVAAAAAAEYTAARAVELTRLTALGAAAAQRETTAAQSLQQMEARLQAAMREEGERQDAEREVAMEAAEASGCAASAAPAPAPRTARGPPTARPASAAPVRGSHAASTPLPTRRPASATPGGLGATPGSADEVFYDVPVLAETPGETPDAYRPGDYSRGSGIRQRVRRLTAAAPCRGPATTATGPPTHATRTARRCTCHNRRGCFAAPPSGRCPTACGSTCRRPLEPNLARTRLTRAHFCFPRSRTRRSPRLRRRARPCASARARRSARPAPPRRRAWPSPRRLTRPRWLTKSTSRASPRRARTSRAPTRLRTRSGIAARVCRWRCRWRCRAELAMRRAGRVGSAAGLLCT